MTNHPDFIPFTDADIASLERAAEAAGCSCACATDSPFDCGPECAKLKDGLEQTMTTVERNKHEFTERQSCKTLVESVAGECCGGCESCECDGVAGAEVMDRLRAEEGQ